jgi:hypothetical protein
MSRKDVLKSPAGSGTLRSAKTLASSGQSQSVITAEPQAPAAAEESMIDSDEFIGATALFIQKKSTRWLYLTATFWSLIVFDSQRVVNKESLSNFYDVMQWRITGEINEDEFSSLLCEWMNNKSKGVKKGQILGVFFHM